MLVMVGVTAAAAAAASPRLGIWSEEQQTQTILVMHQRVGAPPVRFEVQVPVRAQSAVITWSKVAFSPNRKLVAFFGPGPVHGQRWIGRAYVAPLVGAREVARALVDPATREPFGSVISVSFSPDSRELLIATSSRVVVLTLASGSVRTLVRVATASVCLDPFWSPDGKSVGLLRVVHQPGVSGCFGPAELDILDAAGGQPRRLLSFDPVHDTPDLVWSPDSQRFAYETGHFFPGDPYLAMLDIATATVTPLSDRPRGPIAFMPDSESLVIHDETGFVLRAADGSEAPLPVPSGSLADAFVVSADGEALVRWSAHAAFVRSLADGRLLASLHALSGFSLDAVDWR
jgi:hypothetical protein